MTNLTQAPREEPSSDSMDPEDDPQHGVLAASPGAASEPLPSAAAPVGSAAGVGGAPGGGLKLRPRDASPGAKPSGRLSPGLRAGEPRPGLAGWLSPPESPTIRAVTWGGGASGPQHSATAATVALTPAAQLGSSPGHAPAARPVPASPPKGTLLGGVRRDRSPTGPALAPPAATCYGEWRHANRGPARGEVGLTSHLTKEVVALREELDRKMTQTESLAAKVWMGSQGLNSFKTCHNT